MYEFTYCRFNSSWLFYSNLSSLLTSCLLLSHTLYTKSFPTIHLPINNKVVYVYVFTNGKFGSRCHIFFLIISTIPSFVLNTTQMDTSRGFVPKLTHIQQASVTYSRFTTWGCIHDGILNPISGHCCATPSALTLFSWIKTGLLSQKYTHNQEVAVCVYMITNWRINSSWRFWSNLFPLLTSLLLFSHLSSGIKVGPTNSTHNTQATESMSELMFQRFNYSWHFLFQSLTHTAYASLLPLFYTSARLILFIFCKPCPQLTGSWSRYVFIYWMFTSS